MNAARWRQMLGLFVLLALLTWLGYQTPTLRQLPMLQRVEDFGAYYTAAVLQRDGKNPYDLDELRPLQQAIDPERTHILMMRCPPWTLPLLLPFTLLDFVTARLLLLALQVGLLLYCARRLWLRYGGDANSVWIAWLLTFCFYPTLQHLSLGQVSLLLLVGFVAFVDLEPRHPWAAGAVLALTTIKPHLTLLFWVVLLLWTIERRRWKVLGGAIVTVLLLTLLACAINPQVVPQYLHMWRHNPPDEWIPPTVGSLLRFALGGAQFWLTFVPVVVGVAWAFGYYLWHRRHWDWSERLPPLLLGCYLFTAYGWVYDLVLLLPALMQIALWLRGHRLLALLCLGLHLTVTAVAVTMNAYKVDEYWFFWIAPMLLLVYLGLGGRRKHDARTRAVSLTTIKHTQTEPRTK